MGVNTPTPRSYDNSLFRNLSLTHKIPMETLIVQITKTTHVHVHVPTEML